MRFANLRISTKIFTVIGVVAISTIAVAITGITALNTLNEAVDDVSKAGNEALVGSRVRLNIQRLDGTTARIAATPTAEELATETKEIATQEKQFEERLATLKAAAGADQARLLGMVESEYKTYVARLDGTMKAAEQSLANVRLDETQQAIAKAAEETDRAASRLSQEMLKYIEYTDQQAEHSVKMAGDTYVSAKETLLLVSFGGIVIGLLLSWAISRYGVIAPLRAIVGCLRRLANGDLTTEVVGVGRKDEIGEIAETTQVFKENMLRNRQLEEEAKQAARMAAEARRNAMLDLADTFERSVSGVVTSVSSAATEMQTTAESMSATAEETTRQATAVAAAAEQATANVQTVATAADELSSSISEIARQVSEAAAIATSASRDARSTNAKVESLAQAAQKVGDVVALIQDIASQTNLLALNATIEAARAGEAGKGFAVVASEVKALATQTAKATDDIKAEIAMIQGSTTEVVEAIGAIGGIIGRINEISATIASAVEEQGAATTEIARNVQQAAQGTSEVSSNISGVTRAATDTGAGATQVLASASDLAKQGEMLRSEVDKFLATVRAA